MLQTNLETFGLDFWEYHEKELLFIRSGLLRDGSKTCLAVAQTSSPTRWPLQLRRRQTAGGSWHSWPRPRSRRTRAQKRQLTGDNSAQMLRLPPLCWLNEKVSRAVALSGVILSLRSIISECPKLFRWRSWWESDPGPTNERRSWSPEHVLSVYNINVSTLYKSNYERFP